MTHAATPVPAINQSLARALEQRLRWTVPVTQPMLLCSQIQRSGGTLLARLFDGHPACFSHPYELKWGRPRKWHWPALGPLLEATPNELLNGLREDWPSVFAVEGYHKYSEWTRRHDAEQVRHYPFIFDVDLQRQIFAAALPPSGARTQRDVLNAYLTSLFNAWIDYQNLYRGPKRWVTAFVPKLIATPDSPERFLADYPDGLLVTILRHPGGWLASFSRHRDALTAETAVKRWLKATDASLRAHASSPERVIVLLFEDLIHRTEAVMRALSDRMGMPFTDTLLEPTFNSMPVLSDSSHAPTSGLDIEVTERYRATLTGEQLALVADLALPRYAEIRGQFSVERAIRAT